MKTKDEQVILVLAQMGTLGGANRSLSIALKHLKATGARLIVLISPGPAADSLRQQGVDVREWSPPIWTWLGRPLFSTYFPEKSLDRLAYYASDLLLLPLRLWKAGRLLARLFQLEKPCYVYVNSLALFPVSGLLSKLRSKHDFRVIWHIREPLNRELGRIVYDRIARTIADISNQIIAISSNEADAFQTLRPVNVLHNSVDLEWRNPPVSGDSIAPRRIAMASAYRPSKGVNDFIEMARIVKQKFPDVEFSLFSPHPIPPRFRKSFALMRQIIGFFSEKLGLALELAEGLTSGVLHQSVNFDFDRPMTLGMYRAMRIYVRCDRSGSPWGRDIIEAMWAGVPVVATGTSQEFIQNGVTGFLVPAGSPDLMAERVIQLLENDDLCCSFSRAAQERARQLFDPVEHGKQLLAIFGLEPLTEGRDP